MALCFGDYFATMGTKRKCRFPEFADIFQVSVNCNILIDRFPFNGQLNTLEAIQYIETWADNKKILIVKIEIIFI